MGELLKENIIIKYLYSSLYAKYSVIGQIVLKQQKKSVDNPCL